MTNVEMRNAMDYAQDHPWLFITFVLAVAIWRSLKYLACTLFDEKRGLLTLFIHNLQKDSKQTKDSIAESRNHATRMFQDNMKHSALIEERIIKRIDENGKEVKYLLGEIINRDK